MLSLSMRKLRNKLVFHFDVDEFGRQLEQMDLDEPIFLDAMGTSNSQIHFVLGDYCAWRTLHEPTINTSIATAPTLEQLTEDISALITDFTDTADKFIANYLSSTGWKLVDTSPKL